MQWHWESINTLKALKCFFYVKLLLKCICFCYTDRASTANIKYLLLFELFEIGKETGKDNRRHYAWNNIPDFGDAAGL